MSELSEVEGESDIEEKSIVEDDESESEIEDDIASTNSNDIKVNFK
jgi:hypothetical protein